MPILTILALLIMPFTQIGASFWVSGATVVFILMVLCLRPRILWEFYQENIFNIILDISAVVLILIPVILLPSKDRGHDILMNLRFATFYITMVWILGNAAKANFFRFKANYTVALVITLISVSIFLFSVIQLVKLHGGYFGLPKTWYVANIDTLPGQLDIMWGAHLRPFGTFGEPSYLAFYCTCLLLPSYNMLLSKRFRVLGLVSSVCLLGTGFVSQSFSFILAVLIMGFPLGVNLFRKFNFNSKTAAAVFGVLLLPLFLSLTALYSTGIGGVDQRVAEVFSGHDASTTLRMTAPIVIMPKLLFENPLGINGSKVVDTVVSYTSAAGLGTVPAVDNAFFNLFWYFGLAGVFLLWRLLSLCKNYIVGLFFFVCLHFNGAIFAIDKVAFIAIALMLYEGFGRYERQRLNGGNSAVPTITLARKRRWHQIPSHAIPQSGTLNKYKSIPK